MLRLGAAQVKQVAHPAPNENPSRPPAMAGRDVATLYMTCRAFMRRNADAPGVRCASSCGSARACPACGPFHRSVVAGSDPCSFHLHITFRFRAAFGARIISFSCADPERGAGGAPRGAHWVFDHAGEARCRVGDTRPSRCERDGAPRRSTVAISGRGTTLQLRQCPPDLRCDLPAGPITRPGRLGPGPPAPRFASAGPRDATPRSVCRIVSGDAPHERGCESCTTTSVRSQVCS
jgi:hypothetical protein